ncbi:MAG: Mov34/MPN/PAD-1 family protein [Candidatus Thermoplasmatota archaeon]|jgi:proteasome lid subunit RPN8/RPN11|nr:Mov34/MPN/PAD-1 family protein [Candidatus Thermoplasmatota archaeon]
MGLFKKSKKEKIFLVEKKWKITRKCLNLILEVSKSNYPKEFGGLLRVDNSLKDTISEIVILPGTVSGDSHAIFQLHMLPIDYSIVGTVHSHPSFSFNPSDADLHLFEKFGRVHIIVANPFNEFSWKAYDFKGKEIQLNII